MSMNEVDKLNSYNALVSANHKEKFIAPTKPKTVTNTVQEQVIKNQASKEAERVNNTGYSSSPAINSKLYANTPKQQTSSSSYSPGGAPSYYSTPTYGGGYNNSASTQYKGNNLDYNSRLAKIRQKAKDTAAQQKKYESSRGAGLIEFEGKYSFSVEKGKVKHHKANSLSKFVNKKVVKQAIVATGVIVLEAALGLAMAEAKSGITGISNEIKKSINNKVK